MRNLSALCWVACLLFVSTLSAMAHQIALKSGQVIEFEKYSVTEEILLCSDSSGKDRRVPLSEIDFDRTRELNATDPQPIVLPGMAPPDRSTDKGNASPSLGDIARRLRTTTTGTTKSRQVFTDDDVSHSYSSGPALFTDTSSKDQIEANLDAAQKYADDLQSKTPRELSGITARDIQFPGRDAWESKLVAARDSLVQTTNTAVFTARTELTQLSKNDLASAHETNTVVNDQIYHIQVARQNFEHVLSEGAEAAARWTKTTQSSVSVQRK